uniref:Cytosol aminopeptidase domain-containing protein n=2 Tax=Chrysotila carterae TaxID=13221 RepID=A0A7S4B3P5_CHRCT
MGAYLGVSQGASEPPKFIHMTYKPSGQARKKVALIGKGLTFDSGGYNIKAGAGSMIEKMKFDMGGAGAVLGAARVVAELAPDHVEAHFIIAACENMVSANAMRPGDILTASNNKTIEVLNTDAEGRLTLADALVYAEQLGPLDAIVDIATLTGACIVALGPDYGGMWSADDELAAKLEAAAKETGELLWRMPLAAEYKDQLKSTIADLKNIGSGGGGSITAALFLKEFVKDTPWAHLDIAGPVWNDKAGGATGYAVRTLSEFVCAE